MRDLFELLRRDLPLAVPPEDVALVGGWSRSTRRVEASPEEEASGVAPVAEVVDAVWTGTVQCQVPTVGIAFLGVGDKVYWVKSAPAAFGQQLRVSLSGHAHFGGGWGDNQLPLVPVSVAGEFAESCRMGALQTTTGAPHVVCEVDGASLFIVLVQGALARTGRCRNWHLRPAAAALLHDEVQALFMQRRTGAWRRPRGALDAP